MILKDLSEFPVMFKCFSMICPWHHFVTNACIFNENVSFVKSESTGENLRNYIMWIHGTSVAMNTFMASRGTKWASSCHKWAQYGVPNRWPQYGVPNQCTLDAPHAKFMPPYCGGVGPNRNSSLNINTDIHDVTVI